MATGVYTHVRWNVGTLAPGADITYRYRAAIPLARNTMTWTGATPTPASGNQSANLDNNSGAEISDDMNITNYAKVGGDYAIPLLPPLPVESDTRLSRSAEDVLIYKDGSSGNLSQGATTTWTLTVRTGEYRYGENITITDTLPSGYCPLGPVNYTTQNDPSDAECDPTGANPSAPYTSATENANGTFTIVWDPSALPKLAHSTVNDTFTLTFPSRTRTDYQNNFLPTTPILAEDRATNSVALAGSAYSRCNSPQAVDCAGAAVPDRIWSSLPQPEAVTDSSSAGQVAQTITIDKRVAASGTNCMTATYVDTVPVYNPGDRVCFRLVINFPSNVDTGSQPVSDFLPPNTTYVSGSAQNYTGNTTANTLDDSAAGDGVLSWDIDSGLTPTGAQQFTVVFSAEIVPEPGILDPVDISGNLMKVAVNNTAGTAFPSRDLAEFEVNIPTVDLQKGVRQVNAGPINNPPIDNVQVSGGDAVNYQVDVTSTGNSESVEVWDVLPTGITCADVGSISDSGVCTAGIIRWTVPSIADGVTQSLLYVVNVPTSVTPNTTYTNEAGVRQYQTPTNTGGNFTYTPEDNIDPANPNTPNVEAADDTSSVFTARAAISKSAATSIVQAGNNLSTQATIGEIITYTVTATLPRGTTLGTNPRITDTPPNATRQPIVGTPTATLNSGALPGGWSVANVAGTATVIIPDSYVVPTGANDVVVLTFTTRVADVATNTRLLGGLPNSANLSWTGAGAENLNSNSTNISVVEPAITQTKSNNRSSGASAGQTVTYTLTTNNPSDTNVSSANDTTITDTLPLGVTPIDGSNNPLINGDPVPGTGGAIWNSGTRTISRSGIIINPGANVVWTYNVQVDNPAIGGSQRINSAVATTTSINGSDPNERTVASTPHVGYNTSSTSTFRVGSATVTKVQTSPATAFATIGEQITYTSVVTIPAGIDVYDQTIVDTIPIYLDFDEYTSATCTTGCAVQPTIQTYTPTGTTTKTIAWDLGNFAAQPTERTITLVYKAHVRSVRAGTSTNIVAGNTITNTIRSQNNFTDKFVFNPASLPASGTFDFVGPNVTRNTTVVEPAGVIDKQVSINGGAFSAGPVTAQPGATYTYRLQYTNTGTSPAYDLTINDIPDSDLTNVTLAAGDSTTYNTKMWSQGTTFDRTMIWAVPGPVAAGATVTLTYTASAVNSVNLTNSSTAQNTVIMPTYFGQSAAARAANPSWVFRNYSGGSDSVTVNFQFPQLQTTKTTGLAGNPDTGPANINQSFPWRIVVRNNASVAQALDTVLTDTLPPDWDYVTGSSVVTGATFAGNPAIAAAPTGDVLTWDFTGQTLAPNSQIVVTFNATPQLSAYGNAGTNTNSATAVADDATGNPENASGPYTSSDTATANLLVPNVTVTKTPDNGSTAAGSSMNWTVVIANTGTGAATDVIVDDVLPEGMIYTAGSATSSPNTGFSETLVDPEPNDGSTPVDIRWNYTSIPAGASRTITVPVSSLPSLPGGTNLVNTATVGADEQPQTPNDSGDVTTTVEADLRAEKSYAPVPPVAGENFTYTIGVTNLGPSNATGVEVTDTLPAEVDFVSVDPACSEAAGVITCPVGNLAVGDDAFFDVVVTLDADADAVSNTSVVSGTSPDPVPGNDSRTVNFNADAEADAYITKSVAPTTINNGETTTYTLVVGNNGPSTARGVVVSDPLPAGMQFVSVDNENCSNASNTVTCSLPDMNIGASTTIEIVAEATTPGVKDNTGSVSTTISTDPVPANNTDSAEITVNPSADLQIVKTGPATRDVDNNMTYNLAVTNLGPDPATGVVVTDDLPNGVNYVSDDSSCSIAGDILTCSQGSFTVGQTKNIQIVVAIPVSSADSTVVNDSSVVGNEFDPDLNNNTDDLSTVIPPAADMEIQKTGPATAEADEEITYNLAVTNNGPSNASGITVVDDLPAGVDYVSDDSSCVVTGQELTCDLGAFTVGQTKNISITVRVLVAASNTTITNDSRVSATQFDPDTSNNSDDFQTDVDPSADLEITKSGPATTDVNNNISYQLLVENNGPSDASNVQVVDDLPNGVTYLSNNAGCLHSSGTVLCDIGDLANGSFETITITVSVDLASAGTSLVNDSSVEGDQYDPDPSNNTSEFTTDVSPAADMEIVKTAPANVNPTNNLQYTLVVRNNGPSAATNVVVTDELPAGVNYVSDDASCSHLAGTVTCNLGPFAVDEEQTIQIITNVPIGSVDSTLTNNSEVEADEFDPDTSNNSDEAVTNVNLASDLQITKTGPTTADVNDNLIYTLVATNNGPSDATGVVVSDDLPAGVDYVSNDAGCSVAGQTVTCSLGALANGASQTIEIVASVRVSSADTVLTNNTDITGDQFDQDPDNNTDDLNTVTAAAADLAVTKTGPATVDVDGNITYNLNVSNNGPSPATNVAAIDQLPTGVSFVSASSGCSEAASVVTCAIGSLGVDDEVNLEIVVSIPVSLSDSTITNIVDVLGDEFDPNTNNNHDEFETTIAPSADLSVTKTGPATANPGEEITYNLLVENNGPDPATGVVLTDTLPNNVTYISDNSGCDHTVGILTCSIGALSSGDSVNIEVVVQVNVSASDSQITNATEAEGDQYDYDESNNEDSLVTTVSPGADLQIQKTADPENINQNQNGEFVLVVTNNGPSVAENTSIEDALPSELEYISDDSGCVNTAGTVDCDLGNLTSGESRTVRITVRGLQNGVWTNTATTTSDTYDYDPGNNTSSADIIVAPTADLAITKTGPATANAHEEITYNFLVENLGPAGATNVVVADPLPAGLEFVSSADCDATMSCSLGSIPNGDSRNISVVVRTTSALAGTNLLNTAVVSSNEYDPDLNNNTSSVTTEIDTLVDIQVEKAGPTEVQADSKIHWAVNVSNNGPSPAENVTLNDPIPSGVTGVTVETNKGTCDTTVACNFGTLAPDEEVLVAITADVPRNTTIGSVIRNIATVSTSTDETETSNNTSESDSSVTAPTPYQAALEIKKTLDKPAQPKAGNLLTYKIAVTNSGETKAEDVRVTDRISSRLKFVSAKVFPGGNPTGGNCSFKKPNLSCLIREVRIGKTSVIYVKAKAIRPGKVVNTAVQSAPNADLINISSTVNTTIKTGQTRLVINKKATRRKAKTGDRIKYRITVRNTTFSPALRVLVCDRLPGKTTIVKSGGGALRGNKLCWKIPYLDGKATRKFRITLKVDRYTGENKIVNTAVASAANAKRAKKDSAAVKIKQGTSPQRGGGVTG